MTKRAETKRKKKLRWLRRYTPTITTITKGAGQSREAKRWWGKGSKCLQQIVYGI